MTGGKIVVDTWFERDRACVSVSVEYDDINVADETIVDWWDEAVYELVEDGILDPKDWEGSAIKYCRELGLLEGAIK